MCQEYAFTQQSCGESKAGRRVEETEFPEVESVFLALNVGSKNHKCRLGVLRQPTYHVCL
jgi:hypothetical protein